MPIYPTLVKTWQYNVNQALVANGSQPTDAQKLMFALVTSFTSSPGWVNSWTILESSNSVAVAGAGGNWASFANLIWANAGTAHSWIVLEQVGVGSNLQVLIDLNSTFSFVISVSMSPNAGYTGGSTTTAPTATDAVPILVSTSWGGDAGGNVTYKLHAMQSTDGACTRVFVCSYENSSQGGASRAYIAFEAPQNPVVGWSNPVMGYWVGFNSPGQALTYGDTYNAPTAFGRAVSNMTLYWTSESVTNNQISQFYSAPNDLSGQVTFSPIGLFSNTPSNKGRHGSLFDIWWGPAQYQSTPTIQFPGATNLAFTQFGVIVVPWNGTIVQMS